MRKRKLLIGLLLIHVITLIAQQNLTLSFEAKHYEGENVKLDSILIKNITRNCDTILYAPDTMLFFNYFVGINEKLNLESNFISAPYPNPVLNNKTSFNINLYQKGNLTLDLFDLWGQKLTTYNGKLSSGNYKFDLNLDKRGTYFLRATFNNNYKSLKIINSSHGSIEKFRIEMASVQTVNNLKTQTEEGGFWYEPGDTLWYVGYAQTPHAIAGSDVLENVPQNQEHLHFSIVEGLPCSKNIAVKYGNHLYPTVQIGEQCWLKENLSIGTMINGDIDMIDNGIIEKYCYDNNLENCAEFGGLYQWNELMNYSEEEATQGICPQGWHVSTKDEFMRIVEDFDGEGCKERGNQHWLQGYNTEGDNTKGFSVVGSGYRQNTTLFEQLKTIAVFHSSTKMTYDWVWHFSFHQNNQMSHGTTLKITGNSIRCIKN